MDNRKSILLVLIIFILFFTGCTYSEVDNPIGKKGLLDLREYDFDNRVFDLNGEWEYYWSQLLTPADIEGGSMGGYIEIPGSWNSYLRDDAPKNGHGYMTFRLKVFLDGDESLALRLPRIRTSYNLWINDEFLAQGGQVGTSRDTAVPQYLPKLVFFDPKEGENDIIIQVSNFHQRSGGILDNIKIGSIDEVLGLRYRAIASELFVFGSLMVIGLYHVSLFAFRRKNKTPLYFGLFCILVAIRTIMIGEHYFIYLFPSFNWEIGHKIQSLPFYLGVPLIMMYFNEVFQGYFKKAIMKGVKLMGMVFALITILTPAQIFNSINFIYQIWTLFIIFYLLFVLIKVSYNREKNSGLILTGALVFLLTSVIDILFLSPLMIDKGPLFLKRIFQTYNLTSYGQLVFAILNSLILAKNFSESLETATLSMIDPLTGLWNRRKYDESIDIEWKRCLRHQRMIGLLIVDVDEFKLFNDTYGHMAGDQCLISVSGAMKNILRRSTDIVARYGGEEFIAVLSETKADEAWIIGEKIRREIANLNIPHKKAKSHDIITVSVGVSYVVPNPDISHDDLFQAADKALYMAKAAGKNQVKVHEVKVL